MVKLILGMLSLSFLGMVTAETISHTEVRHLQVNPPTSNGDLFKSIMEIMSNMQKQQEDEKRKQMDLIIQNQNEIYQLTQDLAKARAEGNQIESELLKGSLLISQGALSTGMISLQKSIQRQNESSDLMGKIIQHENDVLNGIVGNLR